MGGKLAGEAYLNYWRDRIARGPEQVGKGGSSKEEVERQGDLYFASIYRQVSGYFSKVPPSRILEFGSGWGRMLRRLRQQWPAAELFGVELCPTAVKESWLDSKTTLHVGDRVPERVEEVDLAITCTVLQHITDPAILHAATLTIERAIKKGGVLCLLENVEPNRAEHVLGVPAQVYMEMFPRVEWNEEFPIVKYDGERHAVMVGRKA